MTRSKEVLGAVQKINEWMLVRGRPREMILLRERGWWSRHSAYLTTDEIIQLAKQIQEKDGA